MRTFHGQGIRRGRFPWFVFQLFALQLCVAFSVSSSVLAQDAPRTADASVSADDAAPAKSSPSMIGSTGRCGVHVRVLKGWSKSKLRRAKVDTTLSDEERAKIADLSSQLETLPFARYETVSEEQQLISFREKGVFNLKVDANEEQILFVEPAMVTGGLVAVVVDWRSGSGDELLSSKLKVGNGQNVVFGTDVTDDASLILCIKVTCE